MKPNEKYSKYRKFKNFIFSRIILFACLPCKQNVTYLFQSCNIRATTLIRCDATRAPPVGARGVDVMDDVVGTEERDRLSEAYSRRRLPGSTYTGRYLLMRPRRSGTWKAGIRPRGNRRSPRQSFCLHCQQLSITATMAGSSV